MTKIINGFLVMAVLASAAILYNLEHRTRGIEREIAIVKRETENNIEAVKLLNAEWASLTRPERIQQLAEQNLKLAPVKAQQFVQASELGERVPAAPLPVESTGQKDAIGSLLEKMQ